MEKTEIDVSKYDIKDGQTVLVKVPVGPWGMIEIQDYCKAVVGTFKDEFRRNKMDVNFFIFPVNPEGVSPSLEVMDHPPEGSTIVMHVPVGGIPIGEIPKYLKSVKDMMLLEWDKKYSGVHLQIFGMMEDGSKVELKIKSA
jgi:hypothetical protein